MRHLLVLASKKAWLTISDEENGYYASVDLKAGQLGELVNAFNAKSLPMIWDETEQSYILKWEF
jgi:hypothetical protein